MKFLILIFWLAAFIVFYTYIGYGILLFLLVKIKEKIRKPCRPVLPPENELPAVTLFIAAYNEKEIVPAKMKNSLALDYPPDKLTIFWVTDGSDDGTPEAVEEYLRGEGRACMTRGKEPENGICITGSPDISAGSATAPQMCVPTGGRTERPCVRIEHVPERGGKAAAFNRGIAFVRTPVVIFTDANTLLNAQAVKEIVSRYSDPAVGCVAGEKRVEESSAAALAQFGMAGNDGNEVKTEEAENCGKKDAARTEGIYWKYESFLKSLDCRLYSAVGAAGELFSIRTELFRELSSDTLLDDFILSMRIAAQGYKIAYCSEAYAVEGASANIREEGKRKVRIAAGGLQSIGRLLPLLNIFKYGTLSFQYISHRVLRWSLAPVCLLLLFPLNIWLAALHAGGIYTAALILQILFYLAGIGGWLLSRTGRKNKILYVIYYFLFMNYNVFRGAVYLAGREKSGIWEKARRG